VGKADYLVSGDKADLLALRVVQNIPIISARQAVKLLGIAT
jgi:predicted nucleic acid-binding protein